MIKTTNMSEAPRTRNKGSAGSFVQKFLLSPLSSLLCLGASLVTQMVENPPTVKETLVPSPDWEDPLEKGMATHSRYCLENTTNRWACLATVHGVVKSWTQLNWGPKNWCFWTVVLEKTLESPLDCKEIQPVHPKGNWSWIFIGRTDAEAETPIRWPPDVKNWLIGKDPDAGKDWRQEKGMTEDQMVGWHHCLHGHEFK